MWLDRLNPLPSDGFAPVPPHRVGKELFKRIELVRRALQHLPDEVFRQLHIVPRHIQQGDKVVDAQRVK